MKLSEAVKTMKPGKFEAKPMYNRAGDCVICYFKEDESYGDRLNSILTVYRAFDTDEIVGFEIKGVSELLRRSQDMGLIYRDGKFKLSLLLLVSHFEEDGGNKEIYKQILDLARDKELDSRNLQPA